MTFLKGGLEPKQLTRWKERKESQSYPQIKILIGTQRDRSPGNIHTKSVTFFCNYHVWFQIYSWLRTQSYMGQWLINNTFPSIFSVLFSPFTYNPKNITVKSGFTCWQAPNQTNSVYISKEFYSAKKSLTIQISTTINKNFNAVIKFDL